MSTSFDPTSLHTELFIDGAWQKATSSATFPVENPATNEIIAHVADGGPEDAARAIEAAGRAPADWWKTTPGARADIPRRRNCALVLRGSRPHWWRPVHLHGWQPPDHDHQGTGRSLRAGHAVELSL